jgi:AAA domain/Primase C terminal 1 (PriCT-1)
VPTVPQPGHPPQPVDPRHVTLDVVRFRHAADRDPVPENVALGDLLRGHDVRVEKDGPAFSPTIYVPGTTRGNANVTALTALVYDLDHRTRADTRTARGRLRGFAWGLYSTYSNGAGGDDDGCYRLVFPLSAPVPVADYARLWTYVNATFLNGLADPSAKDPAHIYYLPTVPPERAAAVVIDFNPGLVLDTAALVREAPALAAPRPSPPLPEIISTGQRNKTLAILAWRIRRGGASEAAILAALRVENGARCRPPLEDVELGRIAKSAAKHAPEAISLRAEPGPEAPRAPEEPRPRDASPWDAAVPAPEYLAADDTRADFLDPGHRFLVRGVLTEWFSPRGVGKTNVMMHLVVSLATSGRRVLLIDRDNPRMEIKRRLRAFGADAAPTLRIIDRRQAPPLTDKAAWAAFPVADYDVVVVDSLDAASEGVGEQDSRRPSLAIGSMLDVARASDGPAILALGNTVKFGEYGRGSGVVEDRSDLAFEVRDATGFVPTGRKPWVEEIPPAGRADWAGRAGRRQRRERYRLAFACSKFRIGPEHAPFVLEVRHDTTPWSVEDVTAELLGEGQRAQEAAQQARQAAEDKAVAAFAGAVADAPMNQREAESYLMDQGVARARARQLLHTLTGARWARTKTKRRGHETYLYGPLAPP